MEERGRISWHGPVPRSTLLVLHSDLDEKVGDIAYLKSDGYPFITCNSWDGVLNMPPEQPNGLSELVFPLEELSWTITKNASIVSQYLGQNHLRQPSLNSDGPGTVVPAGSPQNIQEARQNLIAASLKILHLAIGPSELLPNLATGVRFEPFSLQARDKTCFMIQVSIHLLPFLALSVRHFPPRAPERHY